MTSLRMYDKIDLSFLIVIFLFHLKDENRLILRIMTRKSSRWESESGTSRGRSQGIQGRPSDVSSVYGTERGTPTKGLGDEKDETLPTELLLSKTINVAV